MKALSYSQALEHYKDELVDFDFELEYYERTLAEFRQELNRQDGTEYALNQETKDKGIYEFINQYCSGINHYCDENQEKTNKSKLLGILIFGWIFHGSYPKDNSKPGYWTKTKYALIHQIFYLWLLGPKRLGALAFPRKFGKTSSEKIFISWCACTKTFRYIVWVGDTDENIKLQLANIKEALEGNLLIRETFGQLRSNDLPWKDNEIKTLNGFHLIAKSKRSPFRGLLDDSPPDLVIADDIDNDDEKHSLMLRDKLDDKLDTSLYPVGLPLGKVRHVGTLLYDDCILDRRIKNDTWDTILFSCWKSETEHISIAPEILSTELLLEIKENFFNAKPVPKPHVWYAEHENKPINETTRKFNSKFLKEWDGHYKDGYLIMTDGRKIKVRNTTAVDIASSEGKLSSDSTVVTSTATDDSYNLYVLKVWRKHNAKPSETVAEILSQYDEFQNSEVHIETIAMQDYILETWRTATIKLKMFPQLHQIRSRKQSKDERLKGAILTKLESGKIYLKAKDNSQRAVIDEMNNYSGTGAHDDVLDTLADNIVFSLSPGEDSAQVKDKYGNRPLALRPNKTVQSQQDNWIF